MIDPQHPKLRDGSDIALNGLTYRIALLGRQDTHFVAPSHLSSGAPLSPEELDVYQTLLSLLDELAQKCNELNERLLDRCDGAVNRAVTLLMRDARVSAAFKHAMQPYFFALLKHACNVLTERGSVLVPPLPRPAFERELLKLDATSRSAVAWSEVLDVLFDPVPLATQGFYLFDSAQDLDNFRRSLGAEYSELCAELRELFGRALQDSKALQPEQWDRMDRLSQKVLELQKAPLEAALEQASEACRGVATRVRIRCDVAGRLQFRATHYSKEFAAELGACSALLTRMQQVAPARATELREVLGDFAAWCVDDSEHDTWAESRARWVAADDADSLLDVNLTFEEKVSRIGAKGGLQLLACSFDAIPPALREVYDTVRAEGRKQNLNILFLRQHVVGGGASNYTLAGEKLPDPAGHPRYKVMIFTNTTRSAMVLCNAPLITSATEWQAADLERMADSAKLGVLFHEYGHTLGDYAEFLGDLGGSVEETNAEASAIYQTCRMAREHLEPVVVLEACWTPVRRAMQGPTEAHSHANIVLFDELQRVGAVRVEQRGQRKLVRVTDLATAVDVAFVIALRMRLWELGIPTSRQAGLVEPFDAEDREQDERVAKRARAWLAAQPESERTAMRHAVLEECRAWFAMERLYEISKPLQAVIATMPGFQAVSVVPTDRRFALVLQT
jgi:hypothetical protein